jgi:ribonuclease HII
LFRMKTEMLVAGVDEAGRGCVVGPLVVAGVAVKAEKLQSLAELGVKDSKLLTVKKREALYPEIIKLTEKYQIIKLPPAQIDKVVRSSRTLHKLNRLEAQTMAKIIETLKPDEVFVDAADVIEHRFGNHISECLRFTTKIISEHKADRTYPIVSAASIIAKVERDGEIAKLKIKYGDFGSGYLTDSKTRLFLKRLLDENGEYPSCIRKSWKPAQKAKSELGTVQKTLI